MNKKVAIKIIENEINIILKELKINYVISFDNEDIIIACTKIPNTQIAFNHLKSRYDNKKYWEYVSSIIIKNDYIVRISLN